MTMIDPLIGILAAAMIALSISMWRSRYLDIRSVKSILHYFGGSIQTDTGVVIKASYKEFNQSHSFMDAIVIEYKGTEVSREDCHYLSRDKDINIEKAFRKDVERLLKSKYKLMKAEKREERRKKAQTAKEKSRKLAEDYKGIKNHY